MKKNLEDKLIELAFGELSQESADELQRQTLGDAEAASALESYRQMKEGLRDLRDVPADQLSKERLRDAILARGLEPSKPRASYGWLWLPVATAVVAFTLTVMRPSSNPGGGMPVVVADNSTTHSDPIRILAPDIQPDITAAKTKETDSASQSSVISGSGVGEIAQTSSTVAKVRHHRQHTITRSSEHKKSELVANVIDPPVDASTKVATAVMRNDVNPQSRGGMRMTGEQLVEQPKNSGDSSIVIIGTDRDSDTGAQTATEVESSSNVVIGG